MATPYKIKLNQFKEDETVYEQEIILHDDEDADGKPYGRFLTLEAFVMFLIYFFKKHTPGEFGGITFNRNVLQTMLAFPDCAGIKFIRGQRKPDKEETIIAVAINAKGYPLGWNEDEYTKTDKEKLIVVEWGKGFTAKEGKDMLKIPDDFTASNYEDILKIIKSSDFANFFKNLK
jgi:hypothetical protein